MSHRQGMITVVTIFAVCAVFAATLIVSYDETHDGHVPGTPFVLRNGPSRTPERFAAWNRWAEYGLIAFQRYANRYLGGGIRPSAASSPRRSRRATGTARRAAPVPRGR